MMGGPSRQLLSEDADFMARWRAAIVEAPLEEQSIKTEIMQLYCEIERQICAISNDLRDCNVIAARTLDRLVRFNATEGLPE